MPGWTKLLEVVRCLAPLQMLAGYAAAMVGLVGMIIALATGAMQPIQVPPITGLMLVLGAATWWVRTVHRHRLSGCEDTEDMIRGEIARASLAYVTLVAGIAGLSSRPLAWRRTPKFANQAAEPSPFTSTRSETIVGSALLVVASGMLLAGGLVGSGVALLSFVGFASLGLQFLCAPLVAGMAIRRTSPRRPVARPRAGSASAGIGPMQPLGERPAVVLSFAEVARPNAAMRQNRDLAELMKTR